MIEPFSAGFGGILGLIGLILTIWAIYDILAKQTGMDDMKKLIWILVVIFLNLIGVILYYLIEKR